VSVGVDAKTVVEKGEIAALNVIKLSPDRLCRFVGSCGFGAFGTIVNLRSKQAGPQRFLGARHCKGHMVLIASVAAHPARNRLVVEARTLRLVVPRPLTEHPMSLPCCRPTWDGIGGPTFQYPITADADD
jgi:hypothetical protein